MKNPDEWAGHLEISYMSEMLDKTIVVVKSAPSTKSRRALEIVQPKSSSHDRKLTQQPAMEGQDIGPLEQHILIGHIHEEHYVSLETIRISNSEYLTNSSVKKGKGPW